MPDAVTPLPGAPKTTEAPWHNAPPTGAYESPEVAEVRAYDKGEDGTLVAKVVQPPTRPTRKTGPKAEAKMKGATAGPAVVDEAA